MFRIRWLWTSWLQLDSINDIAQVLSRPIGNALKNSLRRDFLFGFRNGNRRDGWLLGSLGWR